MKNKNIELHFDAASLASAAHKLLRSFSRYAAIMCFVLVSAVYGFVLFRINSLSTIEPDQAAIDAQTKNTPAPRIDPSVARQLEELQDNSVNVQTLFNEARDNPFQ